MTGINSYSITAASNVQSNTGINWDEGMAPGQVNNSARQNMADMRSAFNDLVWFQYGIGDKAVAHTYASSTSTTVAGADVTTAYHAGRRVRAMGSSTGTIYGAIATSAYSSGSNTTTVTYAWDSGALANEAVTIAISQISVTGSPVAGGAVVASGTPLPLANGGTASTTAADARTALGVPADDGTGASGTWGISISGTAATATTANGLNSSNSYTAVDFTITSDDRLKERRGDITDALDKIGQLTGFYYVPNALAQSLGLAGKDVQTGLSAQDVQKVLPQAVRAWDAHPDYLTVPYDRLIPLLVEGIKQLRTEITALKGST